MNQSIESVAIIGAGMAGISCAVTLSLHIPEVKVFEKLPNAGGRMSTMRIEGYEFDHGTQYFTVCDEVFRSHVETWDEENLVRLWGGWFVDLEHGNMVSHDDGAQRFVAIPNMAAVIRHLARLCDVVYECEITSVKQSDQGWELKNQEQCLGSFNLVIFAAPAPEIATTFADTLGPFNDVVQNIQMSCCWCILMGFTHSLRAPFDAALVGDSPLHWIARNNSKAWRTEKETWVLHASPEWSEMHRGISQEQAYTDLSTAFSDALGADVPEPDVSRIVFWPYSTVIAPAHSAYLFDHNQGLGLCGDWCLGPRLENAFLSGIHLAEHIISLTNTD